MPTPASGQVAAAPIEPLTSVKQIQDLGVVQIEASPRPVKLTGVVTFVSTKRDDIKLHDGQAGIGVSLPDGKLELKAGDKISLEGETSVLNVQDHLYPHIRASKVEALGAGVLPQPITTNVEALVTFQHYDQWVSAEGTVLMWTHKSSKLSLMIAGAKDWAVVHVQEVAEADIPKTLHGARVRFTGVNMGISHSASDTMMVPSLAHLEVIQQGTPEIFETEERSLAEVANKKLPTGDRVKVRGVVTARTDDRVLYIRAENDAACLLLLPGWLRSASGNQLYGDAGRLPELKPGDEVEAVGSVPDPSNAGRRSGYSLLWCHVRVIGSGRPPLPRETTLAQVASGALTHDWVRFSGRLVHTDEVPAPGGQWRTSLLLQRDGVKLPVTWQGRERDQFRNLRLDDEVLVTGVMDLETPMDPRQLWLAAPRDATSLGLSPEVKQKEVWAWAGGSALVIAALALWIALLSRAMKRQRVADAAIREANASLEQRVEERTRELKAAKQEIHRALEQEKQLGELKSRFVTMVSHEFRTPLGIIMSAVELMRHYEDQLPAEQRKELCEDIHGSTRQMAGLMEQVLVLGRVEAGKLGFRPAIIDLATLMGKLVDESLSATSRRCPVTLHVDESMTEAYTDESLVRHILSNLITNAVKYSPEGSDVNVRVSRDGEDAVFVVEDSGIGIPEAEQSTLYEAFHRCSNVGEIPGTGLGLVIVKRCVDIHGGSISIQSKLGHGTTFTVRLPTFGQKHL